jgi:hypothetical protein
MALFSRPGPVHSFPRTAHALTHSPRVPPAPLLPHGTGQRPTSAPLRRSHAAAGRQAPFSFPPRHARPDPPPPFLPLIFFPPSRARDTCLSFCHCYPVRARGASAAPPPLSFNQAARWVCASRFMVLHRSFSPGTPRARSISTFPRHP